MAQFSSHQGTQPVSSGPQTPSRQTGKARLPLKKRRVARDRSRRFAMGLMVVITAASLLLGWGLARLGQATAVPEVAASAGRPASFIQLAQSSAEPASATELGDQEPNYNATRTVDYVPQRYQLGQRFYLENCATCHVGVPPQLLPSEAWRNLIQDSSHYGVEIRTPQDPSLGIIWAYLREFSRQKSSREERVPYRLARSRYFKALHPEIPFPQGVSLEGCATCHRAAQQFSFRPWELPASSSLDP